MFVWIALAAASSMAPARPQVCARADVVVVGEVTGVEGRWSNDGIESLVDIAVDRATKGAAPGSLSVRVLGGSVGKLQMHVSEAPVLVPDQRYLLLLVRKGDSFEVLGREGAIAIRRPDGNGVGELESDALASLGACR